MNRPTFNAMLAQYAVKDVSGEGAVSWDRGAHCVMPEVVIGGKAVQDGTPTPDAPVTPVFSEGTEVVCRGKNLFNQNTLIVGRISAADFDTVFDDDDAFRTIKMWLPAGTYTLAFSEKCFTMRKYLDGNFVGISISTVSHTFTSAADGMVGFSFRQDPKPEHWDANVKVWLVKGEATPYEPYFDGGTATAPELLAIPGTEYRDEWNPQTGRGVRRLHKFVMDGTDKRNFKEVHNTQPADVFVVWTGLVNGQTGSGSPLGLTDTTEVLCNYFPYESGYFYNRVAAFRNHNRYYGLVAKFPYSMFGITKGEKTDEELLALVNAWLVEKNAEGNPLYYYYVMETPEEFQTEPQPLIQPKGTGQLIQTGGSLDGCPVSAKAVTHS